MQSASDLIWTYLYNRANSETVYAEPAGGVLAGPFTAGQTLTATASLPAGMYSISGSFILNSATSNTVQLKIGATVKMEFAAVTSFDKVKLRIPSGGAIVSLTIKTADATATDATGHIFATRVAD